MAKSKKSPVSAQVILFGKGREKQGSATIITRDIADYTPDEKSINNLSRILRAKGFEVGKFFGISMSITAPAETFEKVLGAKIYMDKDGSPGFAISGKKMGREINNENLPSIMKKMVHAVTFTEPPDFGPTGW